MRKRIAGLFLLLAACSHADDGEDGRYFALPPSLEEISGLAAASPDSVFAHYDESGAVYEISLSDGSILRSFGIGPALLEDDFEGIAAEGDRLWIINSEGLIRTFEAGLDGARVGYVEHDTGLGERCEVEGLSLSPEPGKLLIACKRMRRVDMRGTLVIYQWDAEDPEEVDTPWRQIDLTEALGAERERFAPSAIEWLPELGQILVLAARGHSMLVLDETGRIIARHRLNPGRHPQPEGVTVVGSNRLVIADESQDGEGGQIAVYRYPL